MGIKIIIIKYLKRIFGIFKNKTLPIKIEIEYDGAKAICKVNGKYFNECDSFTKATALSAFSCIEQHFKRTNS